ncbi:FAD-binding protein [Chloroflexota bacterium]
MLYSLPYSAAEQERRPGMAAGIVTWDKEADVIVVGYGDAGAVAAITAYDAGARVLILEKSEHPGGSSVLAGGSFRFVQDVEQAVKYFTRLCDGRTDADVIRAFAEGMAENLDFSREMAKVDNAEIRVLNSKPTYPFEGGDGLNNFMIIHIPGFNGFPWISGALDNGPRGFKMFMDNVESRRIEVMLDTPARRLVRDNTGSIIGVIAQSGGKDIAIRAKRGVILACGGYEQNEWLKLQYLQGKPFFSMAPLTHTGDGVIMAQEVGAALWHMWHVHGSYGFKFPEYPVAFRHIFSGPRNSKRRMPWIVVNKLGRRYMDEYPPMPQDTSHRPMEVFDPDLTTYPGIPSYMIFDEEGRRLGPIGQPMGLAQYYYEWSRDNSQEIERGWIISAQTIPQLAEKIMGLEENEGLMDTSTLAATVEEWNRQVADGSDPLGRIPSSMMLIKTPPYYAAQVWPIISNTQGGPAHDARQQILDAYLKPIPKLYAAGELGSFFSHLYQGGGNLGECISSGRVAGRNAAQETPWFD